MDDYPAIPERFRRAMWPVLDQDEILEVWQAICDEFGQRYGDEFEIRLAVRLPDEED